jgi:hypothetical protein
MKTLLACVTLYVVALGVWIWLAMPAERPPASVPANVQFCYDWRDEQVELCERIPFRKEWAI